VSYCSGRVDGEDLAVNASSSLSQPSPGQGERPIASCLRQGPTAL
jgi:hypothetical protein